SFPEETAPSAAIEEIKGVFPVNMQIFLRFVGQDKTKRGKKVLAFLQQGFKLDMEIVITYLLHFWTARINLHGGTANQGKG
ncbi:MAG: hypothetical protein PVJ70_06390, partial [Syntrophobacterales bacterium]